MKKMYAVNLNCSTCGEKYPLEEYYKCPKCKGILDIQYDYEKIRDQVDLRGLFKGKTTDLWKYRDFLPVGDPSKIVSLCEGATPLLRSEKLEKDLNVDLYLKDETRNPTKTFKDRPYTVGVSKANELNIKTVVVSSTGNAAASLAAYAAKAEMRCIVIVPENIPRERILQIQAYGGFVVAVRGTCSDAFKLSVSSTQKYGWHNVTSTFLNPYTMEGDKTMAYEIYEQLDFKVPDWIIIPVSVGALLVGCYKGFRELYRLGLIDGLPHMIAAQAEGCSPIVRAFREDKSDVEPWDEPKTIAKSIGDPLQGYLEDGTYTLRVIRESGGYAAACSDEEILESIDLLARKEGIFAEPASAAPLAVLKKLVNEGKIDRKDSVVCAITGDGLKDVKAVTHLHGEPPLISPSLDQLGKAVGERR